MTKQNLIQTLRNCISRSKPEYTGEKLERNKSYLKSQRGSGAIDVLGLVAGLGGIYLGICGISKVDSYRPAFNGRIEDKQIVYTENKGSFWNPKKYDEMTIQTKDGKVFRIIDRKSDNDISNTDNSLKESNDKPEIIEIKENGKTRIFYTGDYNVKENRAGENGMKKAIEMSRLGAETRVVFDKANKLYPEMKEKIKQELERIEKQTQERSGSSLEQEINKSLGESSK